MQKKYVFMFVRVHSIAYNTPIHASTKKRNPPRKGYREYMTIEQLAGLKYPACMIRTFDINEPERNAFMKGLELAMEFGKWVGDKRIEWTGLNWWNNATDEMFCSSENEAFEIFLTEKYGNAKP
jgi:hypothetical protein